LEDLPEVKQLRGAQPKEIRDALPIAELKGLDGECRSVLLLTRRGFALQTGPKRYDILEDPSISHILWTSRLVPLVASGLNIEQVIDRLRVAMPEWFESNDLRSESLEDLVK
jgi:hypothetical protein